LRTPLSSRPAAKRSGAAPLAGAALTALLAIPTLAGATPPLPRWARYEADRAVRTALLHLSQGDSAAAEASAERALRLDPQALPAHRFLCRLRLSVARWADARRACEALATLSPGDAEPPLLLGRIALELSDAPGARAALDRAQSLLSAAGAAPSAEPALLRALLAARLDRDWPAFQAALRDARATDPRLDLATLPLSPDYAPLREDAEFLAALQLLLSEPRPAGPKQEAPGP
jgi:tetratricopeptide (TPR) repeat protein